jgi:23S rRNA (uridine2552-2'-O)-methyltransferase
LPRSKSSRRWLKEHFNDSYVQQAQAEGYRSRAVYKLIELQTNDHLFKKGMRVVDLGAAPGSWSQVIVNWVGPTGLVIAVDCLPMSALKGVVFIQGDFAEETTLEKARYALDQKLADVVVSDMAPNISGNKAIDQPRMMYLAELALDFANETLKPDGAFLIKIFQGEAFDTYLKRLKTRFKKVVIRKPKASRKHSAEVYVLARGRT